MSNAMYLAAAAPAEILSSKNGVSARMECACCGGHDQWGLNKLPPPDIVLKHFTQKGWNLRKRPICPECQAKKRIKPVSVSPIKVANQAEPSDAAKKAKRLIYQALEDYYDDSKKAYRPGHSDETIAKEVGAAVEFVKSIRETDFGPLAAPTEVQAMLEKISGAETTVATLRREFDAMVLRNGWAR